jgi:hypothetical protein
VPKRCHSRPSPRCLLGRLGGDVMPKPCHRRLSLRCLPPSRHLPRQSAHSLPLMAIIPPSVPSAIHRMVSPAVEKSGEASLPLRPAIRRMLWQVLERFGGQAAYTPQSFAWCRGCGEIREERSVQYGIHCMLWQAVERFGEQAAYSPQSIAWSRRPWTNPVRQLASPAARNPSDGLASSWRDSASKPPIVRNPSHGLAGCGEIRRGSRLPCSPQSFAWSGKFWRDSASKSPIVRNPSRGVAGCGEIR